jgi:hypothetical protein
MYTGKVQCTIQQESFQQRQEQKQETWYWVNDQSPQESLPQEALQSLQEEWWCIYYAQQERLLYEKDELEKANYHATKKRRKKPNPTKNSFVQLSKKLEKLEEECYPKIVPKLAISLHIYILDEKGWFANNRPNPSA